MAEIKDHLTTSERYEVIDLETGEPIKNIAWADDQAGKYETFRMRPRTLSDPSDADLRLYHSDGKPKIDEHEGEIEIVDLSVHPLKGPLLALLDDPDVVAKVEPKQLWLVVAGLLDAMKYLLRDDSETAQDKLESARHRFHKAFLS